MVWSSALSVRSGAFRPPARAPGQRSYLEGSWFPLPKIGRRGIAGIEVDLNAEAIGLLCGQMLFQHPALGGFECDVSGPARRVGEPTILYKLCVEQFCTHETAAVGTDFVSRRLHGLRHFLEIGAYIPLHELARLRFAPCYARTPQQTEVLCVYPINAKVYGATRGLRKGAGQLERALCVARTTPLGHERAQAIIVVLEHDSHAHFELGNQSQLLEAQGFSRQGFASPIIVTDHAVNPDGLDLSQEVLTQLLGCINSDVALSSLAHRCRIGTCVLSAEKRSHHREHAWEICPMLERHRTALGHVAHSLQVHSPSRACCRSRPV